MFLFLIGLVVGLAGGVVGTVLLSKNNKNTIAKMRADILAAYNKTEGEAKNILEKWKN